jgi:hypothetical protein
LPANIPLPPGQLAASPDDFQLAWNRAAQGTGVAPVNAWTQKPVAGNVASYADLGGNLRLVVISENDGSPVAVAALGWVPLTDQSQEATQNAAFQAAFSVLTKTVNATITDLQEAALSRALGITDTKPPFPDGTSDSATQGNQRYQLRALTPEPQSGVYTLVGVSQSS